MGAGGPGPGAEGKAGGAEGAGGGTGDAAAGGGTGPAPGADQTGAAPDPTKFIPIEKYNEVLASRNNLEQTVNTFAENFSEGDAGAGPGAGAPTGDPSDALARRIAQSQGISVEDARAYVGIVGPIFEESAKQYNAIIYGMADKQAVLELKADPVLGDIFKEHEADVNKERAAAAKQNRYLSPQAALDTVVARLHAQGKLKTRGGEGGEGEGGNASNPDEGAARRAAEASGGGFKPVRGAQVSETKAAADMTPDDRQKLLEGAADQGITF